jgi:hypothetical protein
MSRPGAGGVAYPGPGVIGGDRSGWRPRGIGAAGAAAPIVAGSAVAAGAARLQHDLVQVGVEVRNPFANSNNINHLAANSFQQLGPGKRRVSTERDFVMPIPGRLVRMMYWGSNRA